MGFMQRVKVMLGLADDYEDEYYGDEEEYTDSDDEDAGYEPVRTPAPEYKSPYGTSDSASVRRVSREPDLARAREAAPLRAVPTAPPGPAPQVRIHTIEPRSYSEAQSIADKFKMGQPVIMNLTTADPDLGKRLIDFASGLTYGLDGGLQKVSERVFMLTPANVDVSAEDRRRLRDKGLFSTDM
jgi:cell division inhibitor SepF